MGIQSIDDIYAKNDQIRTRLVEVIGRIGSEEEELPTENGKWTVAKVVEHLAKVDMSMIRIASKLLSKARDEGLSAKEGLEISAHFIEATSQVRKEGTKLEAPQVVQPEGGQPVADSLKILNSNRRELNELKPMFEQFDGTAHTFPHPSFGELTAIDWLVLLGGHESRHTDQIERILSQKDAAKA